MSRNGIKKLANLSYFVFSQAVISQTKSPGKAGLGSFTLAGVGNQFEEGL
jgi:hypothetical protein